jgi:D-xylose transport system permease protein
MSDIIEKNDSPEPSEASQVSAFGGGTTEAAAVEVPSYMPRRTVGQLLRSDLGFIPVVLTLLVVVIYFSITTGGLFLTPQNLTNLVGQIVTFGILGLGVIMVLLLGEIDLSIAAVSVYSAVVMAVLSDPSRSFKLPAIIAILAGLLAGALAGLINGLFVAVLRVPSFIVTLAASIFYSGLLLFLLAGQSTLIISSSLILNIAGGFLPTYLGIALPLIAVLVYAFSLIMSYVRRKRAGLRTLPILQVVVQIVVVALLVGGLFGYL